MERGGGLKISFWKGTDGKREKGQVLEGGVKVCRDVIINFTSQLLFDLLVMWRPKDVESVVTFHLILLA